MIKDVAALTIDEAKTKLNIDVCGDQLFQVSRSLLLLQTQYETGFMTATAREQLK